MLHQKTLRLQGADNFRSLKGMVARCGRRIGSDALLRADQLHSLTDEDWQTLQRLGLRTVCDLRSAGERDRYPNRVPDAAIKHLHLEVLSDVRVNPRVAAMLTDTPQAQDAQDMMLAVYRQLPGLLAPLLPTLFKLFTQNKGSVLIHCTAGKDRTGVVVMLLLHALGVAPECIMDDYLCSARRFSQLSAARQEAISHAVSRMAGRSVSEAALDAVLDARPEYLNAAYRVIESEYGGLDRYLQSFSGLSTADFQTLRDALLIA
nr:tyrosine-protein phosphatase [uncultured Pseudomonas sp.]